MKKKLAAAVLILLALFMATGCNPEPEKTQPAPKYATPEAVDTLASDLNSVLQEITKNIEKAKYCVTKTTYFDDVENSQKIYIFDLVRTPEETDIITYTYILGDDKLVHKIGNNTQTYELNGKSAEESDSEVTRIKDKFSDLKKNIKTVTKVIGHSIDTYSLTSSLETIGSDVPSETQTINAEFIKEGKKYACVFTPTRSWTELFPLLEGDEIKGHEIKGDALNVIVNGETIDMNMDGLAEDTIPNILRVAIFSFGFANSK